MSPASPNINKEICHELLDAAEEVVARDGVARLTLEAVARQAGLSKSGLLHHFHSKDSLIEAVVQRTVERWRESLNAAFELQPEGPHRTARALLECCLGEMPQWNERLHRSSTALLAVLVHCSGQNAPRNTTAMHQFYQQVHARMEEEGRGQATGDLVLAVIDGIWLRWVTGLAPLSETQVIEIREKLKEMLPSSKINKKKTVSKSIQKKS